MKGIVLIISAGFIFLMSSCGSGTDNAIPFDSISIAKGSVLFTSNCSGCHNFNQNGIGPDLSGVAQRDSASWIRSFVLDPKKMIDEGDPHAKKLFAEYHTLMPSFHLTGEEISHLISYLRMMNNHKPEAPDPLAIKNPIEKKIVASQIQVPLQLMATVPPSSDKEPLTRICKMDWITGTNSWFIMDQRGILYKQKNQQIISWLDIRSMPNFIPQPGLATGFGSFAFHPGYLHNGIFYTTHTEAPHTKKADFPIADSIKQTLQWVLEEWKNDQPLSDSFHGSHRELLRIDMVAGIHGVQEICFNPGSRTSDEDYGLLYVGVGDGGSVENGYAFLTTHPSKIWGTIIRIDPSKRNSKNGQYGIPTSNPFAARGDSIAVREIYAYGFRNPNRFAWTSNRQMLATNIGQANIEAIDLIRKSQNYGWPVREGKFLMIPGKKMNNLYPVPSDDSAEHIIYPVAEYDHDEGKAIAGGFEYTGHLLPSLRGKYIFGDIPTGRLFYIDVADIHQGKLAPVKEWFVSFNGNKISLPELCGQSRVDLRFARDEKGELIIFTKPDGKIYRLITSNK